ncbi:Zinc finger FYVE domain-containing protein [Balamuthia mandrillaris]
MRKKKTNEDDDDVDVDDADAQQKHKDHHRGQSPSTQQNNNNNKSNEEEEQGKSSSRRTTTTTTADPLNNNLSFHHKLIWGMADYRRAKLLVLLGHHLDEGCLFALLPKELIVMIVERVRYPYIYQWDASRVLVLDPEDKGGASLVARRGKKPHSIFAGRWVNSTLLRPLKKGQVHYLEFKLLQFSGKSFRIGVAEREVNYYTCAMDDNSCIRNAFKSWALRNTGEIRLNMERPEGPDGKGFGAGDVVGLYVDLIRGAIAWFVNGVQVSDKLFLDKRLTWAWLELYPCVSWGGPGYTVAIAPDPDIPILSENECVVV